MDTIEIIVEELNKKGVKPSQMMSELGFSSGLFSQWKSGLQKPSSTKLEKIAEYLDCSVDYLLGKPLSESALTEDELKLLNSYRQLSEQDKPRLLGYADCLESEQK